MKITKQEIIDAAARLLIGDTHVDKIKPPLVAPSNCQRFPWPPRMIKIGADGRELPPEAIGHVAVLLPDYGLMFDAREPTLAGNWAKAKDYAADVDLFGHSDWRLPESHELQLLIRHDRHKPAIDTEFFPHTPINDWYWTNTVHASDSSYAWGVNFYDGVVGSNLQNFSGFVRAVRSVSASQ